jgi:hypothetical protein
MYYFCRTFARGKREECAIVTVAERTEATGSATFSGGSRQVTGTPGCVTLIRLLAGDAKLFLEDVKPWRAQPLGGGYGP